MEKQQPAGFSLIETVFAIGVLSVAALGMAGIFTQGMQKTDNSPAELIATQKAAEAIESVFSARDSHSITWAQLQNVAQGGIAMLAMRPPRKEVSRGLCGQRRHCLAGKVHVAHGH